MTAMPEKHARLLAGFISGLKTFSRKTGTLDLWQISRIP
jgi:hypothetical protein